VSEPRPPGLPHIERRRTPRGPSLPRVGLRVLVIGAAIAIMAGVVLLLTRIPGRTRRLPDHPAVVASTPGTPISAEAGVFRTTPADLAVAPATTRRPLAHRRTLDSYRKLREYPGAPPRVPHGLTAEEYRGTGCLTCHLRGGYAARFSAYAPPTPHPELGSCLQCHLPDAALVGIALPPAGATETCSQCHTNPDVQRARAPLPQWHPAAWPAIGPRPREGDPPPAIPHPLQMRTNCLACHGGPTAVEEIRTTHPERSSCRQCHLPANPEIAPFARPADGAAQGAEAGG
jgi:cytochrome c-type protein NapB